MNANVRPKEETILQYLGVSIPRERLYLRQSDVIIKDLKDLKGRTGWRLDAMAKDDQAKEDTIEKSGAHQMDRHYKQRKVR